MCTYLNGLGMASGSTLDMLVTVAMSVNYLQNIAAMTSLSGVLPEAIPGPFKYTHM